MDHYRPGLVLFEISIRFAADGQVGSSSLGRFGLDLFKLSGAFEKGSVRILCVPAYYFLSNLFVAVVESCSCVSDVP